MKNNITDIKDLKFDISKEMKQLKKFKLTDISEFDSFCFNFMNSLYDTYEYMTHIPLDDLSKDELKYIQDNYDKLKEQVIEFDEIMYKIGEYQETKNFLRYSFFVRDMINGK